MNLQLVTDPAGRPLWPPERTHDLTATHRHRTVTTPIHLRVPILADPGHP
ncbi:two-component response regulator, partial [Streptomyces sp. NBRC 110611]